MAFGKKKIVVIYHADCLDGFGAAYAAWKKFGNKAEYIGFHHSEKPRHFRGKQIYFLDFIYKDGAALRKLLRDNRVTAIDHHVSTKKLVFSTANHSYALNHSGAVLAWKYFHPGKKIPTALLYIEDMDLWKLKMPKTREVRSMLELLPFDFKTWDPFIRKFENPGFRKEIMLSGGVVRQYEERQIDRTIANYAELVNFMGHKVYAINSPVWTDEIGHALYRKQPPFAIVWRKKGNLIRVSIRGSGKVDLTKIAGKFGGGGHRGSSGFTFPARKGFPWKAVSK